MRWVYDRHYEHQSLGCETLQRYVLLRDIQYKEHEN